MDSPVTERVLASIQEVLDVFPHTNADRLEVVKIKGWNVVEKKGLLKKGDKVVYFEIDSYIPFEEWVPEVVRSKFAPGKRFRVKTILLRSELSQGLVIPLSVVHQHSEAARAYSEIEDDLTTVLKVTKFEKYECLGQTSFGTKAKSTFPTHLLPKTDEARIQSSPGLLAQIQGRPYEMTLKMDGTSSTYLLDPQTKELLICSRNQVLERHPEDTCYHYFADSLEKMLHFFDEKDETIAIQGEIVGPKINNNLYKLKNYHLLIFNIILMKEGCRLAYKEMKNYVDMIRGTSDRKDISCVPLYMSGQTFEFSQAQLLELATIPLNQKVGVPFETPGKGFHEGIVIRCSENPALSFKVISNSYLLKNDA